MNIETYGKKPKLQRMLQRMTNPFHKKQGWQVIGTNEGYKAYLKRFTR